MTPVKRALASLISLTALSGACAEGSAFKSVTVFPSGADESVALRLIDKAWTKACGGEIDKRCAPRSAYAVSFMFEGAPQSGGCVGAFDDGASPLEKSNLLHHVEYRCNGDGSILIESAY